MKTPNSNPSPSVLDPSIGIRRPERAERRVLLPMKRNKRRKKRRRREEKKKGEGVQKRRIKRGRKRRN